MNDLTVPSEGLPDYFVDRLKKQYAREEFERILSGLSCERKTTFRVNRLKATKEEICALLKENGVAYSTPAFYGDAFCIEPKEEPLVRSLPAYEEGKLYFQSFSSMLPPLLLNPKAKEQILDMAAAPGGKTTQIAALSANQALVTACEKNSVRAERLSYNLKKQGATRVNVLRSDATALSPYLKFDKILLDAPCSGSGTVTKKEGKWEKVSSEKTLSACVKAQTSLLKKAVELLKMGGELVYSTCSLFFEENEAQVENILKCGSLSLEPISKEDFVGVPRLPVKTEGTLCVLPTDEYEGFFLAKFKKIKQ